MVWGHHDVLSPASSRASQLRAVPYYLLMQYAPEPILEASGQTFDEPNGSASSSHMDSAGIAGLVLADEAA